jgi:hypothetical protein
MWTSVLAVVSVLGSGIQAGALLMVLLGVCPTMRHMDIPEWMSLHVSLDKSIERYMPALNILTGGTTLALLFLAQDTDVRILRAFALACNISLALMSELVNVRINKAVAARVAVPVGVGGGPWLEAESEHLSAVRERWISWHVWRTVVIVTGFALYVLALVLTTTG